MEVFCGEPLAGSKTKKAASQMRGGLSFRRSSLLLDHQTLGVGLVTSGDVDHV